MGVGSESVDCIKLPDGRIVSVYDQFVLNRFAIHDGKVFEKHTGPLKCEQTNQKGKENDGYAQISI